MGQPMVNDLQKPLRPAMPAGSYAGAGAGRSVTWSLIAGLVVLLAGQGAAAQGGADFRGSIPPQSGAAGLQRGADAAVAVGQLTLTATVSEEVAQRIEQGLVWRIFAAAGDGTRSRLLSTHTEAHPTVRLPAGDYLVVAAFGRAYATKRVKVTAGAQASETLQINAGVLRLTAFSSAGERLAPASVRYDILSDDRDQFGQRPKVASNLRPGTVVRLNSGLYHIVSVFGDANVRATADLTVEPGKLTDVSLAHHAAKVTFKLVPRAGGEALPDTLWSIATRSGEVVKESAGALPVHILAPGSYVVSASTAGRSFRRSFVVRSGESAFVEVVMQ